MESFKKEGISDAESLNFPFRIGDKISIRRKDGYIEVGWKIQAINESKKLARIVKIDRGTDDLMSKTVSFDEIIKLNQSLIEEKTGKKINYADLGPRGRQVMIRAVVQENRGNLVLEESGGVNSGQGYLSYNLDLEKLDSRENEEINKIQADIGRKFIDSITGRLKDLSIDPRIAYGKDKWETVYKQNPKEIIKFLKDSYGFTGDAFDFKDGDPAIELLDNRFKDISREYKIHLQPEKVFVPEVVKDLVQLLREDGKIRAAVLKFKVSIADDAGAEIHPEIVIYPKLGKENYILALSAILKKFEKTASGLGSGEVPRKNVNMNKLISVAQSGGDFKNMLEDLGLLDLYFDKSRNYGFAREVKKTS